MILKPQDILVLLKLVAIGRNDWSYSRLAVELGMSPSEVHSALKCALTASLALGIWKNFSCMESGLPSSLNAAK